MSMCNFCTLKRLKASQKKLGNRVILRRSAFLGGINAYWVKSGERLPRVIVEPQVNSSSRGYPVDTSNDVIGRIQPSYPEGDPTHKTHFLAWFKELGDRCEC